MTWPGPQRPTIQQAPIIQEHAYIYLRFDEGEEDLDPRDHEERSEDRAVSFLAVKLAVVFQEVGLALHLDKVNQSGNNK